MPIDRNSAQYITGALYKPTQTSAPGVWDLDDQANNIAKNLWPLPPQAVQRSLRFNSADSAYLNRTPASAGNRRTWTWSGWIKRSTISTDTDIFGLRIDGNNQFRFYFNSSDKLDIYNQISATIAARIITTQVFRDVSSWYNIVLAIDTTNGTPGDRLRLYVNGIEIINFDTDTQPSVNYDTQINTTNAHLLGYFGAASFNGYMSEINFVDGQQLTAASFGETDPQTGVWIPKRYTGTYGTNGFRLSFANNSSTTALGYDSSGQGNNWTANNFSVTPGTGNDSLVDVPSMYNTDTGLGGQVLGNYATFNPLVTQRLSLSDGNLKTNWVTGWGIALGSIAVNSGMWYFESYPDAGQWHMTGVDQPKSIHSSHVGGNSTTKGIAIVYDPSNSRGDISYNGGNSVYTGGSTTFNSGDVIGVALDLDNNNVKFYKNNILQYNLSNLLEAGAYYTFAVSMYNGGNIYGNFGQRPFAYPAPTGYKALCTTNLPAPAIGQTSSNQADNHFNVVTYTGNGGTQTISTLDFQPDLVWIKNRTGANSHILVDSIRGVGKGISSEAVTGEYNIPTDFQSFNSNGFTVGYGGTNITNASANNYVAWSWRAATTTVVNTTGTITTNVRANQTSRFSIVRYTGNNGSSQTVGHGLNAIPDMIIVKNLDSSNANWLVYHKSLGSSSKLLLLNTTGIVLNIANYWGSNLPTNSVFGVGDGGGWDNNTNTHRHIAYCWAEVPGYSAFGSYTGNGSSDGPFVYTGFRPRWILIKVSTGTPAADWVLHDTSRSPYNVSDIKLSPNTTTGDVTSSAVNIDILSSGFKIRNTDGAYNTSTNTYIYAAFAETPARLSTAR